MICVPRGFQYIEAFKYESWSHDGDKLTLMGVKPIPQGSQGRCDCGRPLTDHCLLNNQLVCPGLYVIHSGNVISSVMRENDFLSAYRPLTENSYEVEVNDAKKES